MRSRTSFAIVVMALVSFTTLIGSLEARQRGRLGGGSEGEGLNLGPIISGLLPLLNRPNENNNEDNNNNNFDDGDYEDQPQYYYDNRPQAVPTPPAVPEPVQPKPNEVPVDPITPAVNSLPYNARDIGNDSLSLWNDEVQKKLDDDLNDLQHTLPSQDDIKKELIKNGLTDAEAATLAPLVTEGVASSSDSAAELIKKLSPGEAQKVGKLSDAFKAVADAKLKVSNQEFLTADELQDLGKLTSAVAKPGAAGKVSNIVKQITADTVLLSVLNNSTGNTTGLPTGNANLVITVPGIPTGIVIPLGSAAILVGALTDPLNPDAIDLTTGSVAQAVGMTSAGVPTSESNETGIYEGTTVTNLGTGSVNYYVNETEYTIQPGHTQKLQAGAKWVVKFDRGGGAGSAEYTLTDGTYGFTTVQGHWELYKQSYRFKIDNGKSSVAFNYVVNNAPYEVAAGQQRDHVEAYPPVVRFDSGNGQLRSRKLDANAVAEVALDTNQNTLDLFVNRAGSASITSAEAATLLGSPANGTFATAPPAAPSPAADGSALHLFRNSRRVAPVAGSPASDYLKLFQSGVPAAPGQSVTTTQ